MGENSRKKAAPYHISFTSSRRFGIELEVNSFDGESRPPKNQRPAGIEHVSLVVGSAVPDVGSEIRGYEHTDGTSSQWIIKPDSSCGMEIVSPPLKGWNGLKKCLNVVDAIAADPKIQVDRRCSVHVHVEVADLNEAQLASIVAWWIKCEPVFLDAMPLDRKRNRYCQFIGANNMFQHDTNYSNRDLIIKTGDLKYYSMNTRNWVANTRKTVEFRPIEGAGVKDPYLIKNWVRLLIHFLERVSQMQRPQPYYEPKNDQDRCNITPWTSLCWLDPEHVLTLLGFNNIPCSIPDQSLPKEYTLSNGMQQTRNWFLARLQKYMSRHKEGGMRYHAMRELETILQRYREQGLEITPEKHLSPTELAVEQLYGDAYRF